MGICYDLFDAHYLVQGIRHLARQMVVAVVVVSLRLLCIWDVQPVLSSLFLVISLISYYLPEKEFCPDGDGGWMSGGQRMPR